VPPPTLPRSFGTKCCSEEYYIASRIIYKLIILFIFGLILCLFVVVIYTFLEIRELKVTAYYKEVERDMVISVC
jgi:hypothetical protein